MPSFSLQSFSAELDALQHEVTSAKNRAVSEPMARHAQAIADRNAAQDLGADRAFSGWTRRTPIVLETQIKFLSQGAALLHPTRSSAGPWTVADKGRNQGNAPGFAGPGINRKTGTTSRTKSGAVRKVRARQSKRWNGTTAGKGTATRAVKQMDRELPPIAEKAFRGMLVKHFDVT